MLVAILHPAIPENASLEDQDTLVQVQAIAATLERLSHEPLLVPCTLDLAAMRDRLALVQPDMAFNLAESLDGADSLQYLPAAVLDSLGIPYTGNSTEAIFQTTHKLVAKQVLHLAGLPTAAWMALEGHACAPYAPWERRGNGAPARFASAASPREGSRLAPPCIIKAVWEHASRGLDERNVLLDGDATTVECQLREHIEQTRRPCFAEQFIEGREFNVPILDGPDGPQVLPIGEIDFSTYPDGKPRIVCHRAKWQEDSFEYNNTPRHFHFSPEDQPLRDQLRELSLTCWRLFGMRGYARVDFRVDREGRPWILEVNSNPCLSPDAGFAAAVAEAGLTYDEAVGRIVERAAAGMAPASCRRVSCCL